jgi:steroid delta-isomerase-like uncharacterized protein
MTLPASWGRSERSRTTTTNRGNFTIPDATKSAHFTRDLLQALPELHIDVQCRHAGDTAVVLEVIIRGRHLGSWRGLPATGARIEFPLCGIYTFDDDDRLAGEKIYYDRATVLRQLGVLHEPDSAIGRVTTVLTHPLTMAQIVGRKIWARLGATIPLCA